MGFLLFSVLFIIFGRYCVFFVGSLVGWLIGCFCLVFVLFCFVVFMWEGGG